jgi:hypothetical protein
MSKVSIVQFVQSVAPYRAGERAGFDPHVANIYVSKGVAKLVKDDAPKVDPALTAERRQPPATSGGK